MRRLGPVNIEVGCSTAKGDDSYRVGKQLAKNATDGIMEHSPSVFFLFSSPYYNLKKLLDGIHNVIEDTPLIGITTSGEIFHGFQKDSAVLLALASPFIDVKTGIESKALPDWRKAIDKAISSTKINPYFNPDDPSIWRSLTRDGKSAIGIVLYPELIDKDRRLGTEILNELKRRSGGRLPFIGAGISKDSKGNPGAVLHGKKVYSNGLLISIIETSLRYGISLAPGYFSNQVESRLAAPDSVPSADERNRLSEALPDSLKKATLRGGMDNIAVGIVFSSAAQLRLIGEDARTSLTEIAETMPDVPIIGFYGEGVLGLTDDGANHHSNVSVATIVLGDDLSEAAEVALENRHLQSMLERSEEKLRSERAAFQIVAETATIAPNIEGVCRHILEGLIEVLGFEFGAVDLYNETDNTLELAALAGIGEEESKKKVKVEPFDKSKLLGTHVAYTREPVFAPDISTENELGVSGSRIKELGIRSTIIWPIIGASDNLLGIISIAARKRREIDEEARTFFETVAGMFATVLERRNAEEALRSSEERFREVLNSSQDAIYRTNLRNQQFDYVSSSALEVIGYNAEESMSLGPSGLMQRIHPDDIHVLAPYRKEASEIDIEGDGPFVHEYRLKRKDGEYRWFSDIHKLVRDSKGIPLYLVGNIRDITQIKEREEALRQSEQRYRTILSSMKDLVFVYDKDGRHSQYYCSDPSLLYVEPKDFMGKRITDVLPSPAAEAIFEALQRVRDTGIAETVDYALDIKGHLHWFSSTLSLHEDGESIVSVVREITDRRQRESELRMSYRDLELYNSILRHDLANDLQVILALGEALEYLGENESKLSEFQKSAMSYVRRMARVLTVFGRQEASVDLRIVPLLQELAQEAKEANPGLDIAIQATRGAERISVAGGRLLPMVFDNLFRNVVQYAGSNTRIEMHISKKGEFAQIDIVDNGPGIAQDIRNRLFERGISTSGGGLGLYLSRRVLEGYRGTIQLIDKEYPDWGAAFRITLPLA